MINFRKHKKMNRGKIYESSSTGRYSHIQNKIVHGEKTVLNPDSVGIPYFSDGKSQFMLLDVEGENWSEEFIPEKFWAKAVNELYGIPV